MPRSGRPKRTAEEEIAELNLRASEAQKSLVRKRVLMAMTNRPSCIPQLWEKLVSMGINEENVKEKETVDERKSHLALSRQRAAEMAQESKTKVNAALTCPQSVLGKKYVDITSLSLPMLREILCGIDGKSFSQANLKAAEKRMGKEGYFKLIEFCTGLPPEHNLPPDTTMASLVKLAKDRAVSRGLRCLDVQLPPDFASSGLYKMAAKDGGGVTVTHQFTGEQADLDMQNGLPKHTTTDQLRIINNHSEERSAIVSYEEPGAKYLLSRAFINHYVHCAGVWQKQHPAWAKKSPLSRMRRLASFRSAGSLTPDSKKAPDQVTTESDPGSASSSKKRRRLAAQTSETTMAPPLPASSAAAASEAATEAVDLDPDANILESQAMD